MEIIVIRLRLKWGQGKYNSPYMKTNSTPTEGLGENLVVDLNELFFLLIGKDIESQRAFRNEMLEHAAALREGSGSKLRKQSLRPVDPIMEYPRSA